MTCDSLNWCIVAPNEFVLWFRKHHTRSHWQAHGIGSRSVCDGIAAGMLKSHPKRSTLILPAGETPIASRKQSTDVRDAEGG